MKQILCCIGLLLTSAIQAEVSLYGEIKAGIETVHTRPAAAAGAAVTATSTAIVDQGSVVGLRGQSALGDSGVKAIWQVEQSVPVGRQGHR